VSDVSGTAGEVSAAILLWEEESLKNSMGFDELRSNFYRASYVAFFGCFHSDVHFGVTDMQRVKIRVFQGQDSQ
jgi:hypothetical protein